MRVVITMDTDAAGRCWPLVQFGPVDSEQDAQAILDRVSALLADEFGGTLCLRP